MRSGGEPFPLCQLIGETMAEYEFFQLNAWGVVDAARRMKLADDAAALSLAQSMCDGGAVEVWTGKRKLGVVPPMIDRRATDRRAA